MRHGSRSLRSWASRGLIIVLLTLTAWGCGSEATPTVVPAPPTATATEPPTATPVLPTDTPAAPEATATLAAVEAATPTAELVAAVALQNPEPTQDWEVRSLKVGSGRTLVLLAATRPQGSAADYQLLFTDDDGVTWAPFAGGLPSAACLNSLDLDYASTDSLFVGACDGGLYQWTGGGWERISEQTVSVLEVVYQQPQIIWSAAADGGISRSDDGGRTWVRADSGIGSDSIVRLGIDPRDSSTLYAMGAALYQGSTDGQWRLIPTESILSGTLTGIAIEGGTGSLYVSEVGSQGRIWRSENANAEDVGAIRWGLLREFADQAVELLATGPGDSGLTLYANLADVRSADGGRAIADWLPHRSPDYGATWERIVIPGWID